MLTWLFFVICIATDGKSQEQTCPQNEGLFYATSPDCLIYYRCERKVQQTGTCFPWQRFDIHTLTCKQRNEVDCNPEYADVWKPVYGNTEDLSGEDMLVGEPLLTGELPSMGGIGESAGIGGIPGIGGAGITPGVGGIGGIGGMPGIGGAVITPGVGGAVGMPGINGAELIPGVGRPVATGVDRTGGMPGIGGMGYIPGIGGAGSIPGLGGGGSLQNLGGIPSTGGFGGVPSVGWIPVKGGISWIGGGIPESSVVPGIGATGRIPETGEIVGEPGLGVVPVTGWNPGLGAIPDILGGEGGENSETGEVPEIGLTGGIPVTGEMPGLGGDKWIPGFPGFGGVSDVGGIPTVGGIVGSGNIPGTGGLQDIQGSSKIPISEFLVTGVEKIDDEPMSENEFVILKETVAEKDITKTELHNVENKTVEAPENTEIGVIAVEETRDKVEEDAKSSEEVVTGKEKNYLRTETLGKIPETEENEVVKDQSMTEQYKIKKHEEIKDRLNLIFKIRNSNKNNVKYNNQEGISNVRKSILLQKNSVYDINKLTWEHFMIMRALDTNKRYIPKEIFEQEKNNFYSETNGDGIVNVRKPRQQDPSGGYWYWCGSGRFVFVQNIADGSGVCLQLEDPEFIDREGNGSESGDLAGHTFIGSSMFNG